MPYNEIPQPPPKEYFIQRAQETLAQHKLSREQLLTIGQRKDPSFLEELKKLTGVFYDARSNPAVNQFTSSVLQVAANSFGHVLTSQIDTHNTRLDPDQRALRFLIASPIFPSTRLLQMVEATVLTLTDGDTRTVDLSDPTRSKEEREGPYLDRLRTARSTIINTSEAYTLLELPQNNIPTFLNLFPRGAEENDEHRKSYGQTDISYTFTFHGPTDIGREPREEDHIIYTSVTIKRMPQEEPPQPEPSDAIILPFPQRRES